MIGLIWAQAANGVIGASGALPWHLPEDLEHFRRTTRGAMVVMGRRTWESLPERYRPLPGRRNVVLTRQPGWRADGAEVATSVADALARVPEGRDVWFIGGAQVYREALPHADRVVCTELERDCAGDVHAPKLDHTWSAEGVDPPCGWHTSRSGLRYRICTYVSSRAEGHQTDTQASVS